MGLEVVLEVDSCIERPVLLLRPVLQCDLRKGEAHVLGIAVAAAPVSDARDQDVIELDDEVLALPFARSTALRCVIVASLR